jgi:proteasome lid subunit RPN8/RPN11
MALEVDLYRGDDHARCQRIPLVPLLRPIFERLLGLPLTDAQFRFIFLPVPDDPVLRGHPVMVNLRSGHGYAQVFIVRDKVILYQHPHSMTEIVALPLQELMARQEPEERRWDFGIVGLDAGQPALVRPRREVAMSIGLPGQRPSRRMFHVEEVQAPDPPLAALAELGVDDSDPARDIDAPPGDPEDAITEDEAAPGHAAVGVVLSRTAYQAFESMPLSSEVEEGGFLVGHVYGNKADNDRYLVTITEVVRAERTGASLLHFTFTGDSFTRISEVIAQRGRDEQLVGWYHSHLFPATSELGLSSIDVDLHAGTFHQPWQIAGLINLAQGERVSRFYARDGGLLTEMPVWVSGQGRR